MSIKWYLLPTDTSWENYWEETSIEVQAKITNNDYPKLLEAIKNYSNKDSVVLEGGCGLGRWLFFLRKLGYKKLIGVDFITPPLDKIKKHDKEITVKVGNVDSLPIEDSSIDLYLSMGVIEHFEEGPEDSLLEARRVLKKEGIMIISVPYQNYYRSTVRRLFTMPLLKLIKPSFKKPLKTSVELRRARRRASRLVRVEKVSETGTFLTSLQGRIHGVFCNPDQPGRGWLPAYPQRKSAFSNSARINPGRRCTPTRAK